MTKLFLRGRKRRTAKVVEVICPSPLDLTSNGVLKVVVVGTKRFHIARIDPRSARLEGVAPLRFAIEDVASPINGRKVPHQYNKLAGVEVDGIDDLALEFDAREIARALGDLNGEKMAVLELTGKLKDGTIIVGEDIVITQGGHDK